MLDGRDRRATGDTGLLVPIRCFTCGKLIGDKFTELETRVRAGEDPGKVLDELQVSRYCCRRMMITSVDLIDQVLPYYQQKNPVGPDLRCRFRTSSSGSASTAEETSGSRRTSRVDVQARSALPSLPPGAGASRQQRGRALRGRQRREDGRPVRGAQAQDHRVRGLGH